MKYILYAILLLTFSCHNNENDKKTADKIAKKIPIIKKYGFTFNDFSVVEDTLQSGDTFSTILEAYTLPDSIKTYDVTEKIISLASSGKILSMDDYSTIIGSQENIDEIRMLQVRAGIIK